MVYLHVGFLSILKNMADHQILLETIEYYGVKTILWSKDNIMELRQYYGVKTILWS